MGLDWYIACHRCRERASIGRGYRFSMLDPNGPRMLEEDFDGLVEMVKEQAFDLARAASFVMLHPGREHEVEIVTDQSERSLGYAFNLEGSYDDPFAYLRRATP